MIFLEISSIDVEFWIPPLVSFLISVLTSAGGITGAFLLLPFQMSVLGFTSPAVSSTNQLYNIIAIPGGLIHYIREGRMLWQLAYIILLGTLPGVFLGAFIRIVYLPDPAKFKFFAGIVLLYIGVRVLLDMFGKLKEKKGTNSQKGAEDKFHQFVKVHSQSNSNGNKLNIDELPKVIIKKFNVKKLVYEFAGETFEVYNLSVFTLSLIVGIVGGAYGIGGGAIIAPIMVAIYRLPVYTVAGAALMGTFFTSIVGVLFYQLLAPYYPDMAVAPDWWLGILFGIGGLAGIYIGARMQKYMPARFIKWILCAAILFIATKYIAGF